jgi:N-methylhydantoinase A
VDEATGAVRVDKLLTTPKEPAQAVEQGVVTLLHEAGSVPASVESLIHGTMLATNLLIERKGAKTGLLTTAGFRDALEIGREGRYDMYDLFIDPPAPLVPRHRRLEVTERILAGGSVLTPFDESSARAAIDASFPEAGGYVESPVYDRHALRAGIRLSGPAIIEERESTTVGGPGARISVDPRLNLLAEPAP